MATSKTSESKSSASGSKLSTSSRSSTSGSRSSTSGNKQARAAPSGRKPAISDVVARAGEALTAMTGHDIEGVVGIERLDDGWRVQIEVVELRRIPATTDLLAVYEVDLDADAELSGLRRMRRYHRGQPRED
ncbi:gas vesicle protein [Haloactinopolyspora sp.]|uniref:gas vesicle protein GvpO n=1 Tax=Haloactinopolyspora sp. TaxID=1966353 RepID=UPI002623F5F0|nr:gas vesicle protein [Haloactinopolyspora sp.]